MPTSLYLHIGHGKTGSSFLQSALALSLPALDAAGICYPIEADAAQEAAEGQISGGNLSGQPGAFAALAGSGRVAKDRPCLISAESLFQYILKSPDGFAEDLGQLRGSVTVPLHVLLYLRDPVDHAVSQYQQMVKRGRFTGSLADNLRAYRMPGQVLRVLEALEPLGAQVTIRNYSRHRDGLIGTMETWLNLAPGTLTAPAVGQVNRSLTRAELELQRLVNAAHPAKSWRVVSDPLCNRLPQIRSEQPPLAGEDLATFLNGMQDQMSTDAYMAAVPEAERPRIGTPSDFEGRFPDPDQDQAYTFNGAQLEVLANAIGAELKRVEQQREILGQMRQALQTAGIALGAQPNATARRKPGVKSGIKPGRGKAR